MKRTPTRGVKQFLKPDTYKQSEGVLPIAVANLAGFFRRKESINLSKERVHEIAKRFDGRLTAYLLYYGSAT